MIRNSKVIAALAVVGVFVSTLIGIMIWVGMDSARPGPFAAQFHLANDQGQPVDQSIFKGSPALVYFGYTHCPEVCPTTLFEVADWLKALGPDGKPLKAYFFSIDPERDTPEILQEYLGAISNRITGDPAQMKKVIDGWMIYAAKLPSEDGNYHMSHTISLLLIGPDGRLKNMIPYQTDKDKALETIRSTLLQQS